MKKKIASLTLAGLLFSCTTQFPGEAPESFSLIEPQDGLVIDEVTSGQIKIKMINHRLKTRTDSLEYFHQIDFYQSLILNNKIRKDHFLQDGLHLNSKGYEVLKNCLNQSLSQ